MGDLSSQPDLVENPLAASRVRRVDHLQRHGGIEDDIVCPPDVAHSAAADPRDHAIAPRKQLAWLEDMAARRVGWLRRFGVLVKREQRLDLGAQLRLVAALLREKSGPLVGWPLE